MNTRKLWRMLCAALLCAALLLGTAVAEPDMLELDTANATEEDVALELEEGLGEAPGDLPDLDLDLELSLDDELELTEDAPEAIDGQAVPLSNEGEDEGEGERTNVPLKVTYTGEPLTKVYDLTRNAFKQTSSGDYTYLVTEPNASDFTVEPSNSGDKTFFDEHKDVRVKVTSIKKVEQFTSANVGSYTLTFTFNLEGSDARYYTAQAVDIPATITAREVVVTPRAGLSKVYGTKDPAYPDNSWLSTDTSSPLHQDISGQPGYAVPINTVDGKLTLSVTEQQYLLAEAKNNTKFFPNGWLSRKSGEDVGKYAITIGDLSFGKNFNVTLKDEVFTITAKPLSDANITVDGIPNQAYTGKAIKLDEKALVVRYGTMTLKKDTDFTVKYENNTEVGTAKVTLTGKGNYSGTKEVAFNIIKSGSGDSGSGGSGSGTAKDPLAPKGTRLTKLKAGRKQIQVKWKSARRSPATRSPIA